MPIAVGVLWGLLGTVTGGGRSGWPLGLAPSVLLLAYLGVDMFRSPSRVGLREAPERPALYAPPRRVVTLPIVLTAWLPLQLITYADRWGRDDLWWLMLAVTLLMVA